MSCNAKKINNVYDDPEVEYLPVPVSVEDDAKMKMHLLTYLLRSKY